MQSFYIFLHIIKFILEILFNSSVEDLIEWQEMTWNI